MLISSSREAPYCPSLDPSATSEDFVEEVTP